MSQFPILLAAITIDADNDTLQLDEGGSVAAAVMAHGTYWLRGDGGAGDFCPVVVTALNAAFAGGNTYAVVLSAWSISATARSVTVTVSRATGTTTFRVRWNHGSAEFSPAMLGFATEKGAADAADEVSTLSPSLVWVSNERHIDIVPRLSASVEEVVGADGSLDLLELSATVHRRTLSLELVDGRRLWAHERESDPNATLERFWALVRDGRRVEIHTTTISTHPSLTAPALGTSEVGRDVGTYYHWVLAAPSNRGLEPSRSLTGMSHWDLDLHFVGYVA
jgi:hypothetical protein